MTGVQTCALPISSYRDDDCDRAVHPRRLRTPDDFRPPGCGEIFIRQRRGDHVGNGEIPRPPSADDVLCGDPDYPAQSASTAGCRFGTIQDDMGPPDKFA